MKLSFVGDIMLGRFVREKYASGKYDIVDSKIVRMLDDSDCVIANLESPIIEQTTERDDHHLKFLADPLILEQFSWVDYFSLSNNHINDCGTTGMEQTMNILDRHGIGYNGLFKDQYIPIIIEDGSCKVAVITLDDLMNYEFAPDCPWKTLRVGDKLVDRTIKAYKDMGYFIALYAHVGMLFTRFPSHAIRDYLHGRIDAGADLVVTVHSHALGGMEYYKTVPIFHSLGDFVMDGSSFRRRQNYILDVELENNSLKKWHITPAVINLELQTILPNEKQEKKLQKSFRKVSSKIAKHHNDYTEFYKIQYKKEMLTHSFSTLRFLLRTRGVGGMFKMVFIRLSDVLGMAKRVASDRSNMRYDSDIDVEKGRKSNSSIK